MTHKLNSIYDLYDEVAEFGQYPPEYVKKMLHKIPDRPAIDRAPYLTSQAKDKVILDIGASGPMSDLLRQAAGEYHSTDIAPNGHAENFYQIDLDKANTLPAIDGLELIIAGEIIEHLSNAGHLLDLLHGYGVPVILTTPNAFSAAGTVNLKRKIESVNREHVAWYSWKTLTTLVERHNYKVIEWFWYNGQPLVAEGLIFKMEPIHGDN